MSEDCCHCQKPSKKSNIPSCCTEGDEHSHGVDYIMWLSASTIIPLYISHIFLSNYIAQYAWLKTMADTSFEMLNTMWWGVLLGAISVGLLSKVPREFIISAFGKGGTFKGLLRATAAGVLLDLCSHGILMVGTKLYERGASTGQVIAFLLASPWNSFSLTLILIALIGLKWTLAFIVLSMIIALITGWIFDKCVEKNILQPNRNTVDLPDDFHFWNEAKTQFKSARFDKAFFKYVFKHSIKDSGMVVRWLLFGVLIAAALRAFMDVSQFQTFFGPSLLGLVASVFFATVIEVCSEGSAPIAADILNNAHAAGNSFAFLMAGVATDYTEILVLKDATKSWKTALFLPLISVPQVLVISYIINSYY